jgi:hypothetical protein|nr:MAG TPA: hypothetical protein [Caudoviricetes sp.]
MDIKLEIDFDYSKFKENLLSLRNYISLGFRCEDIDFKNAAIASIDRMMEEVLDEHDVNFFDALQNVIDNLSEINTVKDVHDICCEFYYIMDENERVMHREFFEKLKKYRESKIERVVPLTDHELIIIGNKYFDLKTGDECVVDSIISMLSLRYGVDTCAVLYVDRLGNRIACSVDDFRKKFGVKKEHEQKR